MNQNNPENIHYCFPKTEFNNIFYALNFKGNLFVKVPNNTSFTSKNWLLDNQSSLHCSNQVVELDRNYEANSDNPSLQLLLYFINFLGVVEILVIIIAWRVFNNRNRENQVDYDEDYFLYASGFKRFSYSRVEKST